MVGAKESVWTGGIRLKGETARECVSGTKDLVKGDLPDARAKGAWPVSARSRPLVAPVLQSICDPEEDVEDPREQKVARQVFN